MNRHAAVAFFDIIGPKKLDTEFSKASTPAMVLINSGSPSCARYCKAVEECQQRSLFSLTASLRAAVPPKPANVFVTRLVSTIVARLVHQSGR